MGEKINHDTLEYYISYGAYGFSSGLMNIFVNIMFFSSEGMTSVFIFQTVLQVSQLTMFISTGYLIRYLSANSLYTIGAMLRSVVIILLFLVPAFSTNIIWFGIIYGVPSGLFWGGNATLTLRLTRKVNRFNFISISSAILSFASLLAPPIGGLLIESSTSIGIGKYFWDFAIASILLVASGAVMQLVHEKGEKSVKVTLSETIIKTPGYNRFRLYFLTSFMITITISTVLPVYLFEITKSYVLAGLFGTLTASINFVSSALSPKIFSKKSRVDLYAILSVIFISFLFFIRDQYSVILIFVATGIMYFFITPLSNRGMNSFMQYIDNYSKTSNFWINREYYLFMGRIMSLGSLLLISCYENIFLEVLLIPVFSLSILGFLPVIRDRK